MTHDGQIVPRDEIQVAVPVKRIKIEVSTRNNLETVGMVFVCLTNDSKPFFYSLMKLMSQFQFGVPSQCFTKSKYARQKKDQYCSNIALKVNTKLSKNTMKEDLGRQQKELLGFLKCLPC